jgi:hypothetical protein
MEAESALSKLELPIEEQQKLRTYYLNLREEYRKARRTPGSQDPAPSSE